MAVEEKVKQIIVEQLQVDEAPHLARFFFLHKLQRIKILDFSGESDWKTGGVKTLDRGHTADPVHQALPHFRCGVAHTADQPQAGDYDSAGQGSTCCLSRSSRCSRQHPSRS